MGDQVTVYGIKNCDTMKKARAWLDEQGVDYRFHDYKSAGIDRAKVEGWVRHAGLDVVLNRAGMTFRKLPDEQKTGLDEAKAIDLMVGQPSMIKRPIVETSGGLLIGFKPADFAAAFT